ncbi:Arsenite/tail-anchored protein-transporting ATPase (plasmid) [Halomicrobium sp. LC1Hm]|nr:Arsenite/tail-anchored protein-transporting ATPase [Halomicrobium sp. LC1Hm]
MRCATTTWLADNDYETLPDLAPNLSDIFGQEIDPDTAAEKYRQETIEPMRELLGELEIESQLLIVNGHLPESVCEDPFFEEKRADEQAAIERARTEFDADAMATYPLQPGEVSGLDLLEDVGGVLYDGDEATVEVGTATDVDAETAVDFESMTDADAIADQLLLGDETRYLFFTGKGSVGKSTIECVAEHDCVIASGGVRTGLDVAKAIALGVLAGRLAKPLLTPATEGAEAVIERVEDLIAELQTAMFITGSRTIEDLQQIEYVLQGKTREYVDQRHL